MVNNKGAYGKYRKPVMFLEGEAGKKMLEEIRNMPKPDMKAMKKKLRHSVFRSGHKKNE